MKKTLIIICIIIIGLIITKEETLIIPESAIRFRVVANSNTIEDQTNKNKLSKYLNNYLYELTKDCNSSKEVKETLNSNYENIKMTINNYMEKNNINNGYELSIGRNKFPKKKYKGITYEEGYYDSIVLSIGQKQGINWWCIMYPPLCLIDEDTKDVEYTSLVSEILNKYNI